MASVGDGNGGRVPLHFERRDKWFFGIAGLLLASVVPLSMYVFQTNANAAVETAARVEVETRIKTDAALHVQEAELMREFDLKQQKTDRGVVRDNKAMLRTLNDNQRTLMHKLDVPNKRITRMPAGISFDDIDEITKP